MIGKKAKCRKCQTSFRIPGPSQPGDSVGESQMLSVISTPGIPGEGESVPMASAAEEPEPPEVPSPARPTAEASYPSADVLNYSAVPGSKSSPSKPTIAPASPSSPRSSLGAAKASPLGTPPGSSAPGKPGIGPKPSKSIASPISPPGKPAPPPEPPVLDVLSLDDMIPSAPTSPPPSRQAPVSEDPFAVTSDREPAPDDEPKSKKKKKKKTQEIDEDEEPLRPESKGNKREAKLGKEEEVTDPFQTPFAPAPGAETVADPFAFTDTSASTKSKGKKKDQAEQDENGEKKPKTNTKKKSRPQEDDEPEELPQVEAAPVSAPGSNDPFSFNNDTASQGSSRVGARKSRDEDEHDEEEEVRRKKKKKKSQREEEDEPESGPRKYGHAAKGKSNAPILIAGIVGFLALGAVIAAVVMFMIKDSDQVKKTTEKKDETTQIQPQTEAPKEDAKTNKKDQSKKDPGRRDPKKEPNTAPSNDPKMPVDPNPALPMLKLDPRLPTYTFSPAKVKEVTEGPSFGPLMLTIPFEKIRKFLPGNERGGDAVVVWQSAQGVKGAGEMMTADVFSQTGAKVGKLEFGGDGTDVKCDLSADSKFFAAVSGGKVTIWNLVDKSKPIEEFDPYAEKPAHKNAGIAAVYITQNSNNFVTVSTAGAMHLFEIGTKNQLAEFIPPRGGPGRLEQGKNLAVEDSHSSIVMAIGGAVYQVGTLDLQVSWKLSLGGEVGRSFGISVVGNPGRIAYVFETDADKKKERALLFCLPNKTPVIYRWQDTAGVPLSVNWSGTELIVVGTGKGVVWFEYDTEQKVFQPLAMAEHPGDVSIHEATERTHWYVIPMPKDTAKSMLVGIATPIADSFDLRSKRPLETLRLDEKGLWR
jgi:hypothetical protein